jgi:hypothetical protein
MAYYRIYLLSAADKICGFRETSSDSDDDALDVARLSLVDAPAVEVWERARRVGRYAVASECHAT